MSASTKKAIMAKLSGDTQLIALLGGDENGDPAIFNATMNRKQRDLKTPASSWTLPAITFREADGGADKRFHGVTVDSELFDIEVWADTDSALTVTNIAERLDALLHNQLLMLGSGRNYDCVRVSQNPDLYDDKLNLHFGLYRYRLVVSRD